MQKTIRTDIAIFGGGVAGLWLLNKLKTQGFSAVLFESNTLGGGQTHKSQGIIHGGLKYALQGKISQAAKAIASMPALWKQCLAGEGAIDLRSVPILSTQQYLWSTQSFTSKMAGFLANLTLKSGTRSLAKSDYPLIFQNPKFAGQVYSLDEMVIDVHALIKALAQPHQESIYKISILTESDLHFTNNDLSYVKIHSSMSTVDVIAKKYIFTAGSGNNLILNAMHHSSLAMQRRPLHMVLVKHNIPHPVFAHCVGLNSTPRITITTHQTKDKKYVWYLGGQLAEEGIFRDEASQIEVAKAELKNLFPWLDFFDAQFATFKIDRAENKEKLGARPSQCFFQSIGNICIAWPTKLAFAPLLANLICDSLSPTLKINTNNEHLALEGWPHPSIAVPLWDQVF